MAELMSMFGGGGGGSSSPSLTVSPSSSATSGATSLGGSIGTSPLTIGGAGALGISTTILLLAGVALLGLAIVFRR